MSTLYVSPTGSDANPGTLGSPKRTITAARDLSVAGDTVLVDGDTSTPYNEALFLKAGVTFKGAPGVRPCIDGQRTRTYCVAGTGSAALLNARVEGFELRNGLQRGIYTTGTQGVNTNLVINDCWIHHIYGDPTTFQNGIYLGFGNTTVKNCEISHIGTGGEAMGIWMWRNHNALIDSNLIYLCRKSCIREATGLSNTITNNQLFAAWTAFECSVGVGALVANNVMAFCLFGGWIKHSNQNGLAVWGLTADTAPAPYRFWHNTTYRMLDAGLVFGGDATNGGYTRDFDARNNIFVGGGDTAPFQSGGANVAKTAQSYLMDAPTTRLDKCVVDFNCYATAGTFNRPAHVYRSGSSTPFTFKELTTMRTDFGWEVNGADLDPQLKDPVNLDFDYLDTSPVKNMGAALNSPWGSQMGARGLQAPRIRWEPRNLMGQSKTWSAGVWLAMFDQQSPSTSSWAMTPGVDTVVIDMGSTRDITHLLQTPLSHFSTSNVKGHRWEGGSSPTGPWTVLIPDSNYQDGEASTFWEEIPGGGTQCRYLRFIFNSNFTTDGLTGNVGSMELGAAKLSFTTGAPPPSGGGGSEEPPDPPDPGPGGTPSTPTGSAYVGIRP